MGFFSWKTQDTKESIPNVYSGRAPFTVYLVDNNGNEWREDEYEGYGVFGGKDFYALLAEMNGLTADDPEELRCLGIDLAYGKTGFISPNLYRESGKKWQNRSPEDCEFQGYFYED